MHRYFNHRGHYSQNRGRGQDHLGQGYSETEGYRKWTHKNSTQRATQTNPYPRRNNQQEIEEYMHNQQHQASRKWTRKNNTQSATQTNPYQMTNNQQMQYVSHNQDHNVGNWNTVSQEDVVRLSKTLAFLLRHGAEKLGFEFMPGGFLYVDEILWYHKPLWNFTAEQIYEVVRTNNKQRFHLQEDVSSGRWMIRANQGHSTAVEGLELTPIYDSSEVPKVIHGTYYQAWEQIQRTGLSRMNRIHIHFAAGMPGKSGIISGMRKSCEVVIEIDLKKAMEAGIPFFRSANNVILSPGNEKGFIPSTFFKSAFDRHSGQPLLMDFLRSESSFNHDTSSPPDHLTSEGRNQQNSLKRKHEDQSKDQPDPKKTKKDMPELGTNPRSEKDGKTSKSDKAFCRPQKETGKETTKQVRQQKKKDTWEHQDQLDHHLRYGQWQGNEDISKDERRAGTMTKSQNKKEKQ